MSENFSRRAFLKGSAALVGATALMSLSGCDSSKTKVDVKGYIDNTFDSDVQDQLDAPDLGGSTGSGIGKIDTSKFYDVGSGIQLYGAIGVSFVRPNQTIVNASKGTIEHKYYPNLSLLLQNTTTTAVTIRASQFTDAHFNGSRVNVKGLKLSRNGFETVFSIPAATDGKPGSASIKLYLDAPVDSNKYTNQPVSFAFSANGTKKVRCSGTFIDKPIFTITY